METWTYTVNGGIYHRSFWVGLKFLLRILPWHIKHFFLPAHFTGVTSEGKTIYAVRYPFSKKLRYA